MTVGICARCMDGAVLMADRQMTTAGGLKYYQRKTWTFSVGSYHVSSVYAGIPEMANAFQLEFKRALPDDPYSWKPHKNDLQDLIETCLRRVWKKHKQDMQLEMLLCSWALGGTYQLWRSSGKVLTNAELGCIGVGDSSVIRYLFDTFARKGRWMQLEYFVPLGFYVMNQAKKYVEGCGGRTDCIIFQERRSGNQIIYANDLRPVKEIEELMESLEGVVVNLFGNFSDSKLSREGFSTMMKKLGNRIERIRTDMGLSKDSILK
jgi:hypothetical protein